MASTNAKIYEMHKIQVSVLRRAAADDLGMLVVLKPSETDNPEHFKKLSFEWRLAQDMIELGLFKDVSAEHQGVIDDFKAQHGYDHILLHITKAGRLMFDYCDDPDCTVHKLGDPMKRYPC